LRNRTVKRTLALSALGIAAAVGWGEFRLARFKAELATRIETRQVHIMDHNPDAILVGGYGDEPFIRLGTTKEGATIEMVDFVTKPVTAIRLTTGLGSPYVEAYHPITGKAVGLNAAPEFGGQGISTMDPTNLATPFQPIPGGMR
jgi:hypothetical protein